MSANIKEQAHTIVDALPDDAAWDDLSEKIHREQVEEQATQLAEMLESPDGFDQLSREASQFIDEEHKKHKLVDAQVRGCTRDKMTTDEIMKLTRD